MNLFLKRLADLAELINNGAGFEDILDFVFDSFKEFIPYDRIGIALLDNEGNIYANSARTKNQAQLKAGYSVILHESSLNTVITTKKPRIISNYMEYIKTNPNSESTKLIIEEGIVSSIACPLIANKICIGVIFFSSSQPSVYTEEYLDTARMIANYMGLAIEKNVLVDDLLLASVTGFAKLVEAKDCDTGMHIERMQDYSKIIAQTLASSEKYKRVLTRKYISEIYKFCPLHDIGKVGIADSILLKPGKLTPEEFEIMKKHTTIGADVLLAASNNLLNKGRHYFDTGIEIVLGHHEKFNGSGYPYGLKGENIPLSARIVAVADVLDALASKRVYKQAFGIETSFKIIQEESGKSFDPEVVKALMKARPQIQEVYNKYQEAMIAVV